MCIIHTYNGHIVPENKLVSFSAHVAHFTSHLTASAACGPGLGAWVLAASFYYLAAGNSWDLGDLTCSIEMFLLR